MNRPAVSPAPTGLPAPAVASPPRELGAALRRWVEGGASTLGVVRVLDRHGFGTVEAGQLLAAAPDGGHRRRGAARCAGPHRRTARPRRGDGRVRDRAGRARRRTRRPRRRPGLQRRRHPARTPACRPRSPPRSAPRWSADGPPPSSPPSTAPPRSSSPVPTSPTSTARSARPSVTTVAADTARSRLRRGATVTERIPAEDADLLLDLWVPVPSVLVVGAGAIGDALAAQAALLGWTAHQTDRPRRGAHGRRRLLRRRRARPARPRPGLRRRADRRAARWPRIRRRARLPAHPGGPPGAAARRGPDRSTISPSCTARSASTWAPAPRPRRRCRSSRRSSPDEPAGPAAALAGTEGRIGG